jgi:hypothetical protein
VGVQSFAESSPFVVMRESGSEAGTTPNNLTVDEQCPKRIDNLFVLNPDSIVHVITFKVVGPVYTATLCSVSIPIGAGYAGVLPVDVFLAAMPASFAGLVLPPHWYLTYTFAVAPVSVPVVLQAHGGYL